MNVLKPLIKADDHVRGSTNAIITLVEFGDFECSHCGSAYWLVKRLLAEFEGKLRFIYRYFPLRKIHPNAYIAAMAAEAANRQGKFWEMHDLIYENQERLDQSFLLKLAIDCKLDIAEYKADLKSESTVEKVRTDFESGIQSNVQGTPCLFVNGEMILDYDETYNSLRNVVKLTPY